MRYVTLRVGRSVWNRRSYPGVVHCMALHTIDSRGYCSCGQTRLEPQELSLSGALHGDTYDRCDTILFMSECGSRMLGVDKTCDCIEKCVCRTPKNGSKSGPVFGSIFRTQKAEPREQNSTVRSALSVPLFGSGKWTRKRVRKPIPRNPSNGNGVPNPKEH